MSMISVVIPTYNRVDLLRRAIDSVLTQSYPEIELIVCDDGSTDATERMMLELCQRDSRIVYSRTESNRGGNVARNRGIDLAKGQYIAFLDSDDIWRRSKLQMQLRHLESRFCDENSISYHQVDVLKDEKLNIIIPVHEIDPDEKFLDYIFMRDGFIYTSAIMLGAELAKKIRFDEGLKFHQDWDFCIRSQNKDCNFRFLSAPLATAHRDSRGDRITDNLDPILSRKWIDSRAGELSDIALSRRHIALLIFEASKTSERRCRDFYRNLHGAQYGILRSAKLGMGYCFPRITSAIGKIFVFIKIKYFIKRIYRILN